MTKTRHSLFETNSSSVHTLTLGSAPTTMPFDDENFETIYLGSGEYGWGYEKLTIWMEKADYLAIEASSDENKAKMLFDALHKVYPNCIFKFEKPNNNSRSFNENCSGYIDHQSYGEAWLELGSTQDVADFLFGSGYIEIDNDNH